MPQEYMDIFFLLRVFPGNDRSHVFNIRPLQLINMLFELSAFFEHYS